LVRADEMSMPASRIAATASESKRPASDPALTISNSSPVSSRRNASAIWVRQEFSVQRNRTLVFIAIFFLLFLTWSYLGWFDSHVHSGAQIERRSACLLAQAVQAPISAATSAIAIQSITQVL
jgi:hypothetical protein